MEVINPNRRVLAASISTWTHIFTAFCLHLTAFFFSLYLTNIVNAPQAFSMAFVFLFDAYALALLARQFIKLQPWLPFCTPFGQSVDFLCVLMTKLLVILWVYGGQFSLLYAGLPLCLSAGFGLCTEAPAGSFQHKVLMVSIVNRLVRLVLFGGIALKLMNLVDWPWSTALVPVCIAGSGFTLIGVIACLYFIKILVSYLKAGGSCADLSVFSWLLVYAVTYLLTCILTYNWIEFNKYSLFSVLGFLHLFLSGYTLICLKPLRYLLLSHYLYKISVPFLEYSLGSPQSVQEQPLPRSLRLLQISDNYYQKAGSGTDPGWIRSELFDSNAVAASAEVFEDTVECCLCLSAVANAVLMNCGHGGICKTCAITLLEQSKVCFLCRLPINSVLQVDAKATVKARLEIDETKQLNLN